MICQDYINDGRNNLQEVTRLTFSLYTNMLQIRSCINTINMEAAGNHVSYEKKSSLMQTFKYVYEHIRDQFMYLLFWEVTVKG